MTTVYDSLHATDFAREREWVLSVDPARIVEATDDIVRGFGLLGDALRENMLQALWQQIDHASVGGRHDTAVVEHGRRILAAVQRAEQHIALAISVHLAGADAPKAAAQAWAAMHAFMEGIDDVADELGKRDMYAVMWGETEEAS